jgi:hypothetical protein
LSNTLSLHDALPISAAPDNQCAVQRTWIVNESQSVGRTVALTLQWAGSHEGTSFRRAAAGIWSYDGSKWVESGAGGISGADPYSLTSPTFIGLPGLFIIGNDAALPITLASFTARVQSGVGIEIQWITLSEVDNYAFEIERGKQIEGPYNVMSKLIEGNGTTNVPHTYCYLDHNPMPGSSYYRLKQLDLDQSLHYYGPLRVSNPIERQLDTPERFGLSQNYPNPFNGTTEIRFGVTSVEHVTVMAFNALGQEVGTLFRGTAQPGRIYTARFDGSALPSGVYIARLVCGSRTVMRKLLLVR